MEITRVDNFRFRLKGKTATVLMAPGELMIDDFRITGPGEYEVSGVAVLALKDNDQLVFRVKMEKVVFLYPASLREEVDAVDILFTDKAETAAKIEPKLVIPMGEEGQVQKMIKDLGKEGLEKQAKFLISADRLPENMEVVYI
jgi:hypothetical protein